MELCVFNVKIEAGGQVTRRCRLALIGSTLFRGQISNHIKIKLNSKRGLDFGPNLQFQE